MAELHRKRDTPADGAGFEELSQVLAPIVAEFAQQVQSALNAHQEDSLLQAGCTPADIAKIRRAGQARANWRWN